MGPAGAFAVGYSHVRSPCPRAHVLPKRDAARRDGHSPEWSMGGAPASHVTPPVADNGLGRAEPSLLRSWRSAQGGVRRMPTSAVERRGRAPPPPGVVLPHACAFALFPCGPPQGTVGAHGAEVSLGSAQPLAQTTECDGEKRSLGPAASCQPGCGGSDPKVSRIPSLTPHPDRSGAVGKKATGVAAGAPPRRAPRAQRGPYTADTTEGPKNTTDTM